MPMPMPMLTQMPTLTQMPMLTQMLTQMPTPTQMPMPMLTQMPTLTQMPMPMLTPMLTQMPTQMLTPMPMPISRAMNPGNVTTRQTMTGTVCLTATIPTARGPQPVPKKMDQPMSAESPVLKAREAAATSPATLSARA
jgi:hypothetical protein